MVNILVPVTIIKIDILDIGYMRLFDVILDILNRDKLELRSQVLRIQSKAFTFYPRHKYMHLEHLV